MSHFSSSILAHRYDLSYIAPVIYSTDLIDILSSPIALAAAIPEGLRHQLHVFHRLYTGFPQFVALVIAGSVLPLLILVLIRYARARRSGPDCGSFTSFAGQSLRSWRWGLCLLLVFDAFLLSNHVLARGKAVGMWDCDAQFLPYQMLVADHARAWRLIRWDPWTNAGFPLGGDPQVGANSPLNVIVGFITGGTTGGFRLYWLLVWGLGAIGMALLAKQIKAPPWGAAIVAIGFTFSGIFTGHAEHLSWLTAFSAMPWVIWRIEAAVSSGKLQPGIEAGAIWGLSALGGYPAQVMVTGSFAALWALGRWLFRESTESDGESDGESNRTTESSIASPVKNLNLGKVILTLALFSAVGLIVLAPTYFSFFYEGKGVHDRVGTLSRETVISDGAYQPGALMTFASPYLPMLKMAYLVKGDPIWHGLDVSLCSIYAGALIPILALLALLVRPRDKWRWWLMFLGLFNLSCAMSGVSPLRGWLYDWVYPTRFFRHPSLFRAYFILAMAALAIYATRDLAETLAKPGERIRKRFVIASTLLAAPALLTLFWFYGHLSSLPPYHISAVWKSVAALHAVLIWGGAAVAAILFWKFSARFQSWRLPVLLVALAFSDAFVTCVISLNLIAYDGNVERWARLDERHSASIDLTRNGLRRDDASSYSDPPTQLLNSDQLIEKIPVLAANATSDNYLQKSIRYDAVLKRMALGTERIWFARDAVQLPLSGDFFSAFKKHAHEVNGFPIVVHSQQEMIQRGSEDDQQSQRQDLIARIEAAPLAENIPVKLLKYDPEELSFEVNCPSEGWLLTTDTWARSWQAEINGKPAELYGGNFVFRAVRVAAGLNRIEFSYHPFGSRWLIIFSWGTLALTALAAARNKLRQR
ncbi:MAG: hypothetical protein JMDDDDMK_00565 [Acidobacteria bacterium]|nr:hypothetical protein [Acidobacteriota bacterium]